MGQPQNSTAEKSEAPSSHAAGQARRVSGFDVVRGFSVVSMVLFHLCYDLVYLAGIDLAFFSGAFQDVWRCSISWAFVFVAGCMSAHSRNNLRRAGKYLAVALAIFVATTVVAVDTPINFGVIYCMGACTLVVALIERLGIAPRGRVACALLAIGFILLLGLPEGKVGLPGMYLTIPAQAYATPWLSWLGLPGPGFASGDYYPLLPYLLLYLAGRAAAERGRTCGYPTWFANLTCPPLELAGRHSLLIYVLHQPVLLGITWLVSGGRI